MDPVNAVPGSPGTPVYLVAEAGINHDGRLDQALAMIAAAARAGVDAVKFQLFRAAGMYRPGAGTYRTAGGGTVDIYELMARLELPMAWIPRLMAACRDEGVDFFTTVCDEQVLAALDPYPVPCYKVASYEISHLPLFEALGRRGKPVVFSTGGATLGDVEEALEALSRGGTAPATLLHCVASYPTPPEQADLRVLETLRLAFPHCTVGYSDHTEDPVACPSAATLLGARLIEKHFTLDRNLPGADHSFAVDPPGLAALVRAVRETEAAMAAGRAPAPDPRLLGSSARRTSGLEAPLRAFAYRTLHTLAPIAAGAPFTRDNLGALRAGHGEPGIHPRHHRTLVDRGVKAPRALQAGEPVTWDLLFGTEDRG